MSIPLEQALQGVDLEAGRVYRCQVRGRQVELRVLGPKPEPQPLDFTESDLAPVDAWVELPAPEGGTPVTCRPGKLDPPDIPEIPTDVEAP
jgi:hypothetical protein